MPSGSKVRENGRNAEMLFATEGRKLVWPKLNWS